jgi:hypothetical protein
MADEILDDAGSPPDPEAARAGQALERVAERSGVDFGAEPEPTPERPGRGVQTRTGEPPEPTAEPDYGQAGTEFRQRIESRRQQRYYSSLERLAERALRETPPDPGPAAPAQAGSAENPYDRDEDYWNWYQWEQTALRDGIVSSLDQKLQPILSFFERQQQEYARQAEERQQLEARRRHFEEQSGYAREAHETYSATPEGAQYMDRVLWLVGDPGSPGDPARGIPAREPLDGSLVIAWEAAGFPTETARRLSQAHVHGMQEIVMQHNARVERGEIPGPYINPAAAIDRFTRAQLAAAADYFGLTSPGARPNGNGGGGGTARPTGPTPTQRRVAGHKAAAGSAVAGSVAEGGGEGGQDLRGLLQSLASQGRLGVQEMNQLAGRFFPNVKGPKERMNRLLKVLRELEHEAGAGMTE